jgi:hypothetical protein
LKQIVIVGWIVDMDLNAGAEFADMFMKGRFEAAIAQPAPAHPSRRKRFHH